MTHPEIASDSFAHFDSSSFQDKIIAIGTRTRDRFDLLIKRYAMFQFIYFALLLVQTIAFIFSILFANSSFLLLQLPMLILTLFSYFVTRVYLQSKKQNSLVSLLQTYLSSCCELLPIPEGSSVHCGFLAQAAATLADSLQQRQYRYYTPPKRLQMLSFSCMKFSCWMHWHDVQTLQEMLWNCCVRQHIQIVKNGPTQLEAHASLAQVYLSLVKLYIHPSKLEEYDKDLWYPAERVSKQMYDKFCSAANKAIEELKILNDYAPSQPWIHAQLAHIYHDLQMVDEEIAEYELLLNLLPDDQEILFELGILYFQKGYNAKALRIYEKMKRISYKRAEDLIWFYGSQYS